MNLKRSLPLLLTNAMLIAGLATFCAPAAAVSVNLVQNGGFESGDLGSWTEVGNTGYGGVACGGAPEGSCEAFFGPIGSLGGIEQSVATTAGTHYYVSFVFNSDGSTPGAFQVSFGSQTLLSLTNPPAAGNQTYTFNALATSASSLLEFQFQDDNGFMMLDNVQVAAVPEPATFALMGAGLVGLVAAKRRRARH